MKLKLKKKNLIIIIVALFLIIGIAIGATIFLGNEKNPIINDNTENDENEHKVKW